MIRINGNVPSSKNSKVWTGKFLVWSKSAQKYRKDTKQQWLDNKEAFLDECSKHEKPYRISFKFIRGTKHSFDYVNPLETLLDIMTEVGWLADDNADEIVPFFKLYEYNKENPGVEIDFV